MGTARGLSLAASCCSQQRIHTVSRAVVGGRLLPWLAASCAGLAARAGAAPRMLHADKEALRTAYKLRLLAIREKELNYFLQNCINIATLAAMLAGFAQSASTRSVRRAPQRPPLRAQRPARPVPKLTSLASGRGRHRQEPVR